MALVSLVASFWKEIAQKKTAHGVSHIRAWPCVLFIILLLLKRNKRHKCHKHYSRNGFRRGAFVALVAFVKALVALAKAMFHDHALG